MTSHLQAIVTILSLINPIVCVMIFERIQSGRSRSVQMADAAKASDLATGYLGEVGILMDEWRRFPTSERLVRGSLGP